jgi:hypothetical protein
MTPSGRETHDIDQFLLVHAVTLQRANTRYKLRSISTTPRATTNTNAAMVSVILGGFVGTVIVTVAG